MVLTSVTTANHFKLGPATERIRNTSGPGDRHAGSRKRTRRPSVWQTGVPNPPGQGPGFLFVSPPPSLALSRAKWRSFGLGICFAPASLYCHPNFIARARRAMWHVVAFSAMSIASPPPTLFHRPGAFETTSHLSVSLERAVNYNHAPTVDDWPARESLSLRPAPTGVRHHAGGGEPVSPLA
jgi:hypothetical protein